jgi:hypothetical protein
METLFLYCAVIGAAVMIFQFVLTVLGLSDHGGDLDGGGVGDVGHGGDMDMSHVDVTDGGVGIDHGDVGPVENAEHHGSGTASSHIFGVLSFRTIVAAITFFGMAGKASLAANLDVVQAMAIGLFAGLVAMYGVFALMRSVYRLRSTGNVHIGGAVGLHGTVYVPIPASRSGAGKIQLNLQNRTVEYEALTDAEQRLPTGARIVVTSIIGPDTVAVEPMSEAFDVGESA